MIRYLFIILFSALATGCFNQGDCLITATNLMQVKFLKKSDRSSLKLKFSSVTISGTATVKYENEEISTILLPVNPGEGTTTFTLNYDSIAADNSIVPVTSMIKVSYSQKSKILSVDCGAFTYFTELAIVDTSYNESQIRLNASELLHDVSTNAYANNIEVLL